MVGGDEELDDGLGEEGGERGTYIDVFGAWGERIPSRQRSADVENKIDRAFFSLLSGSVSSGSIAQDGKGNSQGLKIAARGKYPQSCALRMTAPSAKRSREARLRMREISLLRRRGFVPAGTTKGLCDRPLETFARSLC